MLRLLICDDAPDARERLRASLAAQPEIEVVAEAANGEEAVSLAVAHRPDVVLMDVQDARPRRGGCDEAASTSCLPEDPHRRLRRLGRCG